MHLLHPVSPPYERELLQGVIHVFSDLFAAIDCRLPNSLSESVTKSDFLDSAVEVHVDPIFEAYFWVVEHAELGIVWLLPFVGPVETVHSMTLAAQALDHEHAEIVVHELKATQVI